MTDFDNIYAMVQEINREWDRAVVAIRTRDHKPESPVELRNVQIVDRYDGTQFGTVVIDNRGMLHSIHLDPSEVSRASENHILEAIVSAINSAIGSDPLTATGGGSGD
ncbi:hypothetical protein AB0L97_33580 [Nocardia sp. NPDC051911]|uniref:hypothetical protein n=1 Tax=Nocardia sp. NPDC051911 TaxID=3154648 RepID=UPI00342A6746